MARTVRSASMETRTARLRLPAERKHWQPIEEGLHVGYRRGPRGGSWYARRFKDGRYIEKGLGATDDSTDGDGVTVLDFRAAVTAAREWWKAESRRDQGLSDQKQGPYTVSDACDDYLAHYAKKGGRAEVATKSTIEVHIRPSLGAFELTKLTMRRVRDWHHGLATAPKRVRTSKIAQAQATREFDRDDRDAVRARRSTANRILTVLKAALNHAWHEGHAPNDDAWRPVKPFRQVDAAAVRYLTADECRRLVNACPPALRNLVRGALMTGARYSELCRLAVRDINLDARSAAIRESKGGKPRHLALTDEGVALFRSLVTGRASNASVFLRDDGEPWKPAQATRPITEACRGASIAPAIGFHVLRHTYASTLAMNGVPMGVIAAQLGHADTRITEKHYAHLAPSYVADTIRANFPVLGINEESNVLHLQSVR